MAITSELMASYTYQLAFVLPAEREDHFPNFMLSGSQLIYTLQIDKTKRGLKVTIKNCKLYQIDGIPLNSPSNNLNLTFLYVVQIFKHSKSIF